MITHSYDKTIKYQQHAENTQNCAEIFLNTFRKNTNSAEKKFKKTLKKTHKILQRKQNSESDM